MTILNQLGDLQAALKILKVQEGGGGGGITLGDVVTGLYSASSEIAELLTTTNIALFDPADADKVKYILFSEMLAVIQSNINFDIPTQVETNATFLIPPSANRVIYQAERATAQTFQLNNTSGDYLAEQFFTVVQIGAGQLSFALTGVTVFPATVFAEPAAQGEKFDFYFISLNQAIVSRDKNPAIISWVNSQLANKQNLSAVLTELATNLRIGTVQFGTGLTAGNITTSGRIRADVGVETDSLTSGEVDTLQVFAQDAELDGNLKVDFILPKNETRILIAGSEFNPGVGIPEIKSSLGFFNVIDKNSEDALSLLSVALIGGIGDSPIQITPQPGHAVQITRPTAFGNLSVGDIISNAPLQNINLRPLFPTLTSILNPNKFLGGINYNIPFVQELTFTPRLSDATGNDATLTAAAFGIYNRIENICWGIANVPYSNKNSMTGSVRIYLPLPSRNSAGLVWGGVMCDAAGITFTGQLSVLIGSNLSFFSPRIISSSGGAGTNLQSSGIAVAGGFTVFFIYYVASLV